MHEATVFYCWKVKDEDGDVVQFPQYKEYLDEDNPYALLFDTMEEAIKERDALVEYGDVSEEEAQTWFIVKETHQIVWSPEGGE